MKSTVHFLRFSVLAVLLLVGSPLAAQTVAAANSRKIHETKDAVYVTIDVPNSTLTCATGISASGKIVGVYTTDQDPMPDCWANTNLKGFLWEGDRFTDIQYPVPAGPFDATLPMKINVNGAIVGFWVSHPAPESVEGGWMWEQGKFSDIKYDGQVPPDGDTTVPQITDVFGINSSGDMVGGVVYLKDLKNWNGLHGWLYDKSKGRFEYFDPPDSFFTFPFDINDRGDIVGRYERKDGKAFGFIRNKEATIQNIAAVPESWKAAEQDATGINSEGVIIGRYYVDTPPFGPISHGYVLSKGVFTQIDPPESGGSIPWGINPAGLIVGSYGAFEDGMPRIHGFVRIPKP